MSRQKLDLKQKVIKINPNQQEMLDTFTQKWGFISESEVWRQALVFYYRKMEPEYLKPSATEQEKLDKKKNEERLKTMTDEEYVLNVMKALIFKDLDGEKVVGHIGNNTVRFTPLNKIRSLIAMDEWFLTNHLKLLAEGFDMQKYIQNNKPKILRDYQVDVDKQDIVDEEEDGDEETVEN